MYINHSRYMVTFLKRIIIRQYPFCQNTFCFTDKVSTCPFQIRFKIIIKLLLYFSIQDQVAQWLQRMASCMKLPSSILTWYIFWKLEFFIFIKSISFDSDFWFSSCFSNLQQSILLFRNWVLFSNDILMFVTLCLTVLGASSLIYI